MVDLRLGDCLDILPTLPDMSVDAIITDIPYGTTACKWDVIIPLDKMWEQVKRICKGAFVTTACQPFTSVLIMSNLDWFRYEIIWDKLHGTDFQLSNIKPMKAHENVVVFSDGLTTFNKQMVIREKPLDTTNWKQDKRNKNHNNFHSIENKVGVYEYKNPTTVFRYSLSNGECNNTKRVHPTQKPVALYEYLIKTYTNEGDTVLDFCMGSGTTGVAAVKTNRNFIGIEKESNYFEIANHRIESENEKYFTLGSKCPHLWVAATNDGVMCRCGICGAKYPG